MSGGDQTLNAPIRGDSENRSSRGSGNPSIVIRADLGPRLRGDQRSDEEHPIERRFKIRPTSTADISQLERVETSAGSLFRETDRAFVADHPPVTPEEHADAIADGLHWVAEIAGTAIGFVYGKRIEDSVYVAELCVARPYQRQGVGRSLMEAVEHHARDIGAARLTLTTYRDLPWNMPFYQSIGFDETEPPPPHLEAQLGREAAAGHDPALRVGLVKAID